MNIFSKLVRNCVKGSFIVLSLLAFSLLTTLSGNAQLTNRDGPYIVNQESKWISYTIDEGDLVKNDLPSNRMATSIKVTPDLNEKSFELHLKPGLSYELTHYEMPTKLIAISDIEGNFSPFRKLLQACGVIDENLEWRFGQGHLVLTGDFFDRGQMVTEVLWLIYKLEWEAWQAGGQVHFILGNHEIMNLQGDLRYVHPKYKKSAELMGKKLEDLYADNTELGQWLRTKNVVEKIGDLLFVHAGISDQLNELGHSLEEINSKARPFLDREYYPDNQIETIMSSRVGPLWYRGYYQGAGVPEVVDKTLEIFDVEKIITGHTVVADQISTHYDGKVINIDTPHSEGKSEALLIEGGNYYAIDIAGNKRELFPLREGEKGVKE